MLQHGAVRAPARAVFLKPDPRIKQEQKQQNLNGGPRRRRKKAAEGASEHPGGPAEEKKARASLYENFHSSLLSVCGPLRRGNSFDPEPVQHLYSSGSITQNQEKGVENIFFTLKNRIGP
jgi:hypothetical protein